MYKVMTELEQEISIQTLEIGERDVLLSKAREQISEMQLLLDKANEQLKIGKNNA